MNRKPHPTYGAGPYPDMAVDPVSRTVQHEGPTPSWSTNLCIYLILRRGILLD